MIRILTTGGTIDKVYFDAKSEYQVGNPSVEAILREGGVQVPYEIESLLRKDSLELTEEDRVLIRNRIISCSEPKVLVTHGTDTMADTARFVGEIPGKCIVFVGSLQPAGFRHSDAVFNVGFALGALQARDAGTYVAMNGQLFDPGRVVKNRAENRFELNP